MHEKRLEYEAFCPHTGDATTLYVDPRDAYRRGKLASRCEEALAFMRSAPPPPDGMLRVLMLAMTGWEYYGGNRNGDGFHARPFYLRGKLLSGIEETLPHHHKSFERVGKNFMHHANKDPERAVGYVEKSFWNDVMHRVELVVLVDKLKTPTIAARILDGDFPAVSMGCKIPYDICVYCGNKAPTRAQYCTHVDGLNPQFGFGTILEDGTQMCVLNPCPLLFDISWVVRPADRHGFMMQLGGHSKTAAYSLQSQGSPIIHSSSQIKVAHSGPRDGMASVAKFAALSKLSELEKYVSGDIASLGPIDEMTDCGCWDAEEANAGQRGVVGIRGLLRGISDTATPFDDQTIQRLADFTYEDVLSSALDLDIVPTPQELFRLRSVQTGVQPHSRVLRALPALQRALVEALRHTPEDLDQFQIELNIDLNPAMTSSPASKEIKGVLAPYVEKRALNNEHIARRLLPPSIAQHVLPVMGVDPDEAYRRPREEVITVRGDDGRSYQTTRRAAEETDWQNKRQTIMENAAMAAGTGATLSSLGLLAAASPRLRLPAAIAMLPTAAAGGGLIVRNTRQRAPQVYSDAGEEIPANSPFAEKRSGHRLLPFQLVAIMLAEKNAHAPNFHMAADVIQDVWKGSKSAGQAGGSLINKTAQAIDAWLARLPI